jgi:hypothetical protein
MSTDRLKMNQRAVPSFNAVLDSQAWAVAMGVAMGYLVWDLPVRFGSIDEGTIYLIAREWGIPIAALLGENIGRELMVAAIVVLRSLPGLVALSVIAGYVMYGLKYPRAFLYAVPLWPFIFFFLASRLFLNPGRGMGEQPEDWLWLVGFNEGRASAVIFIIFFVFTYGSLAATKAFAKFQRSA